VEATPSFPQIEISPIEALPLVTQAQAQVEFPVFLVIGNSIMARMLTDFAKLYNNDFKFGGNYYDMLNTKLRVFYDLCNKAGIGPKYYHAVYNIMLKGKAQDFYYQHFSRQSYSFETMVAKTRKYFHTSENYQLYLNEWRSIMLKNVISANSKKNLT
jgi:hypothetical protein